VNVSRLRSGCPDGCDSPRCRQREELQDVAAELWEFVEEEDTLGGQAEFAGLLLALCATAEEGSGAAGVVRGPEGPCVEGPGVEIPDC